MCLIMCSRAATRRRSPATGACRASSERMPWCTSRERPSTRSSSAITIWASSTSWWLSASSTRSSCSTIRSRPPSACVSSSCSCCWKCTRPCWGPGAGGAPSSGPPSEVDPLASLAELAGDIFLGSRVCGIGEDLLRGTDLDELAAEHECGAIGHARGLLHVVRDDHDRHALLELGDQLLDLQRGDRVERRAGLVHQDHLGVHGE